MLHLQILLEIEEFQLYRFNLNLAIIFEKMYRKQKDEFGNGKNAYITSSPYQQFFLSRKKAFTNSIKRTNQTKDHEKKKMSKDFKKKKNHSTFKTQTNESFDYGHNKSTFQYHKTDYSIQKHSKTSKLEPYESKKKYSSKTNAQRPNSQQRGTQIKQTKNNLELLKITEIDQLVKFIDNCVREANEYIEFLSHKLEDMKLELMEVTKDKEKTEAILKEKDLYIKEIQMKIKEGDQKPFEIKSLVEIIGKLNEQNTKLKKEISQMKAKCKGMHLEPDKKYLESDKSIKVNFQIKKSHKYSQQ